MPEVPHVAVHEENSDHGRVMQSTAQAKLLHVRVISWQPALIKLSFAVSDAEGKNDLVCTPPPQDAEHALQPLRIAPMFLVHSAGQELPPQSSTCVVSSQTAPPLSGFWRTLLERWVTPPQLSPEQVLYAPQMLVLQSMGHATSVHRAFISLIGHFLPSAEGLTAMERKRVRTPTEPQLLSQAPQPPHGFIAQSIGQSTWLQRRDS